MNPEWQVRPYETFAFVQDVVSPQPRVGIIEIGDNVSLHLLEDESREDVCVCVTQIAPNGRMLGVISRANRRGAWRRKTSHRWSRRVEEKQVFKLEKAT